jgi:sensor histidine kinase YesM
MKNTLAHLKRFYIHYIIWIILIVYSSLITYYDEDMVFNQWESVIIVGYYATVFYLLSYFIYPLIIWDKKTLRGTLLFVALFFVFISIVYVHFELINPLLGIENMFSNKIQQYEFFIVNYVAFAIVASGFFFKRHEVYVSTKALKEKNSLLTKLNTLLTEKNSALEKEKELKDKLEGTRHDNHLTFNVLSNIYYEIYKDKPEAAETLILLTKYLRKLFIGDINKVSLTDEIAMIEDYLKLQKKLKDNFSVNFQVEGDAREIEISPRLLISPIENAIKHGIVSDRSKPVDINLKINGNIELTVHNWKSKKSPRVSTGVGNSIMQTMLENSYPDHYSLQYEDREDDFTTTLILNYDQ